MVRGSVYSIELHAKSTIIANFFPLLADLVGFTLMKHYYLPLPQPWTFENLSEYIDQLVIFITRYEHVAKFNTHDVFTKGLPVNWLFDFDVEKWISIISRKCLKDLPDELTEFVRMSQDLPLFDIPPPPAYPRRVYRPGLNAKKAHEVDAMTAFIKETAKSHNITANNVLDVGSGLGYLSAEIRSGENLTYVQTY